ncbi:DNA-binding protein [Obelidium mucronatum]|nr:DNA-binding protein [Obelidium mucronatum]
MEYSTFVDVFIDFAEVAIHSILAERKVYPAALFTKCQKYGLLVRKSRHPSLNGYIKDFLMGIRQDLLCGLVQKIHIVILDPGCNPVEKFVIRIRDVYDHVTQVSKQSAVTCITIPECESFFHTLIQKLLFLESSLGENPADCTFELLCELVDGRDYPQSYEERVPWIQAESSILHVSDSTISPLKSLDVGVVKIDMVVERGS